MVLTYAKTTVQRPDRTRRMVRGAYSVEETKLPEEQGFSVDLFTSVFAAKDWKFSGYEICKGEGRYFCYLYKNGRITGSVFPCIANSLEEAIVNIQTDIGVTGFKR